MVVVYAFAFSSWVNNVIQGLASKYPEIELEKLDKAKWKLNIPEALKVGHEALFGQVTEKYLQFLIDVKLPEWGG